VATRGCLNFGPLLHCLAFGVVVSESKTDFWLVEIDDPLA
jgi:hypothetical protein